MDLNFRSAKKTDIKKIMKIENSGFGNKEAASEQAMIERINLISDSFIVATDEFDNLLGYIVGPVIKEKYLHDELFESIEKNPLSGGYQSVLSLAIDPSYRKSGIGSQLLSNLAEKSVINKRKGITLTCLHTLIAFYEKNGYKLVGRSNSKHAGEIWYNMYLDLETSDTKLFKSEI